MSGQWRPTATSSYIDQNILQGNMTDQTIGGHNTTGASNASDSSAWAQSLSSVSSNFDNQAVQSLDDTSTAFVESDWSSYGNQSSENGNSIQNYEMLLLNSRGTL